MKSLCNVVIALKYWSTVLAHHLLFLLLDEALTLSSWLSFLMLPAMRSCWPCNIQTYSRHTRHKLLFQVFFRSEFWIKNRIKKNQSDFAEKKRTLQVIRTTAIATHNCLNYIFDKALPMVSGFTNHKSATSRLYTVVCFSQKDRHEKKAKSYFFNVFEYLGQSLCDCSMQTSPWGHP